MLLECGSGRQRIQQLRPELVNPVPQQWTEFKKNTSIIFLKLMLQCWAGRGVTGLYGGRWLFGFFQVGCDERQWFWSSCNLDGRGYWWERCSIVGCDGKREQNGGSTRSSTGQGGGGWWRLQRRNSSFLTLAAATAGCRTGCWLSSNGHLWPRVVTTMATGKLLRHLWHSCWGSCVVDWRVVGKEKWWDI